MSELRRYTRIKAPYDCIEVQPCVMGSDRCIPGTDRSHGRGGMGLYLALIDDDAQFAVSFNWHLPVYLPETYLTGKVGNDGCDIPMALGLGGVDYHQKTRPLWDDEEWMEPRDDCELIGDGCFSDGSALQAGYLWDEWMAQGGDVWPVLEAEFVKRRKDIA